MTAWLSLIGIGEDGLDGLSPRARRALDAAETLIGGERHLALVPPDNRPRHPWPRPMKLLVDRLGDFRPSSVAMLCSGDPLWFGVGVHALETFGPDEVAVHANASALHLICRRMGWPMIGVDAVSVHGRPLGGLAAALRPGARLVVLAQDGETPAQAARMLTQAGYGASPITVFDHMDGPAERRHDGIAADWSIDRTGDLCTLAIECRPAPGTDPLSLGPDLPDDAFGHDGNITKRELRAAALAKLGGGPNAVLWDIGAGSGTISVSWARADPRRTAYAIEARSDRCAQIAENAERLGAPLLKIIEGEAPAALDGLPAPDAVFLGGVVGAPGLMEMVWTALKPGGRFVAHAVTLAGEGALFEAHQRYGGELCRLALSRTKPLGAQTGWAAFAPVTQWAGGKPF